MKSLKLLVFAFCLQPSAFLVGGPSELRSTCTLSWDYPAAELATNLTFRIYSSTNATAPVSSWPLYATLPGTNTNATVPLDGQQRYFVVTVSNWWGESLPSNVAATVAPPRSDVNLRIGP